MHKNIYKSIITRANEGITLTDGSGKILLWNKGMAAITGIKSIDAIGKPLWEVQQNVNPINEKNQESLEDIKSYILDLINSKAKIKNKIIEREIVTLNNGIKIIKESIFTINNKDFRGVGSIIQDITMQKILENKLVESNSRDSLTGLYSRNYYEEEVERLKGGRHHFPVSIIYIDVDNLSLINNTFGHDAGDKLLKRVSLALGSDFRTEDSLCRIGGDKLVILLPFTDEKTTINIIKRINKNLKLHNQKKLNPTLAFSIGHATATNGKRLGKAIKLADQNMYKNKVAMKAKKSG